MRCRSPPKNILAVFFADYAQANATDVFRLLLCGNDNELFLLRTPSTKALRAPSDRRSSISCECLRISFSRYGGLIMTPGVYCQLV